MFHRNNEKLESLVGADSIFRGNIETKGTIRIDGNIEGNIEADWVILGEKSYVKGNIMARGLVVGGRVEGNLTIREICEIKNKGIISGEVITSKLVIVEGGILDGRSTMGAEEAKVVELFTKEATQ